MGMCILTGEVIITIHRSGFSGEHPLVMEMKLRANTLALMEILAKQLTHTETIHIITEQLLS